MKVLLGVSGSPAAGVTSKMVSELLRRGHQLKIITTEVAQYFCQRLKNEEFNNGVRVYEDSDARPGPGYDPRKPVLHVELINWCDLLLIAPLTANTLSMMAHGLSSNLLSCSVLELSSEKPLIVAPAMSTSMWQNPIVVYNLKHLKDLLPNLRVVNPVCKVLACGTEGEGAMANVKDIVDMAESCQGGAECVL